MFRLLALIWIVALVSACGPGRAPGTQARATSEFQARLDALNIPLDLPTGPAILVNVPAYELIAFEDGEPVLRSRIIVGRPADPTPIVDTYTTRVLFRPSWRPTPEMVASGEVADGIYPPGRNNPMGLAAVALEPGMLEYLHDTNQRQLFARERRAFSHGCIRVQEWQALIAWLLEQDEAWVMAEAQTPPTRSVATRKVPVLIRYLRVFPAADGTVLRHPDIYGLGGGPDATELGVIGTAGKDPGAKPGGGCTPA